MNGIGPLPRFERRGQISYWQAVGLAIPLTEAVAEEVLKHMFGTTERAFKAEGAYLTILSHNPEALTAEEAESYEPETTASNKVTCNPTFKRFQLTTAAGHGELVYTKGSKKAKVENGKELELIKEITAKEGSGFKAEYWAVYEKENTKGKAVVYGSITEAVTLTTSTWPVKVPAKKFTVEHG
jgi:hypothetical protein